MTTSVPPAVSDAPTDAPTSAPTIADARAVPVGDGVWAWVQGDGGWCVNNAGVVVGSEQTVVVDTAATRARADRLRDAARALGDREVATVVNTHFHGDHVFGNCAFDDTTAIVAQTRARDEIAEAGLAMTGLWPTVEWGDVALRVPTVTFDDTLTLAPGGFPVELLHVGPAHTVGDAVVWLPEQRVLFAGDVVWSGVTPFCLMGSVAGSLVALERLARLDPAVVVSGHGPVGGAEVIAATAEHLRWVTGLAAAGARAGRSPLEVARETDLGPYGGWRDPERLVGNLARAYRELQPGPWGERIDLVGPMTDMVAFHGGPLHSAA